MRNETNWTTLSKSYLHNAIDNGFAQARQIQIF